MFKKGLIITAFILFPLVIGLACSLSQPDPTATPVPTATEVVMAEQTEPTEEVITQEPTLPPTEESERELNPLNSSDAQGLVLLDQSLWAQKEGVVFVSFFIENPNEDLVFEDTEYTIYLYDANGNEIDSDYSNIRYLYPQQAFGITHYFYLSDESVTVDSVDVDWTHEKTFSSEGFTNPMTSKEVTYWQNDDFPIVTGSIFNDSSQTYTDVRINIICYDSASEIVGGGYTYLDFAPNNDYMGFISYVDIFDEQASSCEIYPTLTYTIQGKEGNDFWNDVTVVNDYFYEDDYGGILGGAVIQNNTDQILQNTVLYATFYDDTNKVTTTGTAYVDIIMPGADVGLAPWVVSPPEGANTTNYDILVLPGEVLSGYELAENPFIINDAQITGDYNDYVTISFTNTYNKSMSEVDVYILLYNADGLIIGGGNDWTTEPIPAGGTSEAEIWVNFADGETVDTIEVWITPNLWTEFD